MVGNFGHVDEYPSELGAVEAGPKMSSYLVYLPGSYPYNSMIKFSTGRSRMYLLPPTGLQKKLAGALTNTEKPLFFNSPTKLSKALFVYSNLFSPYGKYFH